MVELISWDEIEKKYSSLFDNNISRPDPSFSRIQIHRPGFEVVFLKAAQSGLAF